MLRTSSLSAPARLAVGLVALVAVVPACGQNTGPGTEEELREALTRDDTFTAGEAECIANAVFQEYGTDEDALQKITRADDYDTLTGDGEDSVEGFGEFFDDAVTLCTGG